MLSLCLVYLLASMASVSASTQMEAEAEAQEQARGAESEVSDRSEDLTDREQEVLQFILGLHPDWRESYCDQLQVRRDACRENQEEGYESAKKLARIFVQESDRANLGPAGPFWLASVAMKENSLKTGDLCVINVTKAKLFSLDELTPSPAGERRARLCIQRQDTGRVSCRNALVLEEADETIKVNYCMAGEVGLFQLTRHEASAGTVVPATGETLPRSYRERRERLLDATVNTSIAASALSRLVDHCCPNRREECLADWSLFVGAYNTGSCHGTQSANYGQRIRRYYEIGLENLCREIPESGFCDDDTSSQEESSR